MAADVAIEQRMVAITEELRCLRLPERVVSPGPCRPLPRICCEIRKMIAEGKSDKREILDFMVARYGDFVRYTGRR